MISLFIAGNLITVAQNNVSAKEKTADSNNVTRKDNQEIISQKISLNQDLNYQCISIRQALKKLQIQ